MYWMTAVVIAAFLFSFWRENRSLWNPILLLISIMMLFLSVTQFVYQAGFVVAHDLMFGIAFVFIPFVIFLSGIFLIYNGVVLLKREGRSKANYLSLGLGVAILIFYAFLYIRFTHQSDIVDSNPWLSVLMTLFSFSYLLFGFAFAAFLLYSFVYLFVPKKKAYDYIIIHGAGLLNGETVTPLLKRRIDKAVEAFKKSKNPNVRLVASGGQGADEKVSEAQAIATYIFETYPEIQKEQVLLENQSKTTYENLLFSKKIGEQLTQNPTFLFVTNDYHVFRTSMYARQIGLHGDGLGCSTASYYIPSAFIREYIAVCVRYKWIVAVCYMMFIALLVIAYRGILW